MVPYHDPLSRDAGDEAASTLDLLTAARGGDPAALDRLFARYIPGLRQWASGRLPAWARDLSDTHDLVQETVFRVFRNLERFEYRGEGALKAYLRHALMNRLRNELRRAAARPEDALDTGVAEQAVSPGDLAFDAEVRERYEAALGRLSDAEREILIARMELGLTYQEIATVLKRPSADAVRMTIGRALVRLSEEMGRDRP